MTLSATEFIRRMLLHVLPPGFHAPALKWRSGYRIGRPLEKPAAHLILSFHRSEIAVDEVHTRKAEIVKTARSALRALGLEDRQAVIVAHTGHVRQVGQHPRLTEDPREPDDRPVRRPSRGRLVAGEALARRRRPRTTYRRKPASAPRRALSRALRML